MSRLTRGDDCMIWSATTRAFDDVTLGLKSVAATAWEVTTTARVVASVTAHRRSTVTIQVSDVPAWLSGHRPCLAWPGLSQARPGQVLGFAWPLAQAWGFVSQKPWPEPWLGLLITYDVKTLFTITKFPTFP